MVLQTTEMGKAQTVAVRIKPTVEPLALAAEAALDAAGESPGPAEEQVGEPQLTKKLPGVNPCCWLGFSGPEFIYSESAAAGISAIPSSYLSEPVCGVRLESVPTERMSTPIAPSFAAREGPEPRIGTVSP